MWRYKLVPMRLPRHDDPEVRATEAALNVLGEEGWEAVSIVPEAGGWCWVLLKMSHQVGTY
jgi:hypothetical protein